MKRILSQLKAPEFLSPHYHYQHFVVFHLRFGTSVGPLSGKSKSLGKIRVPTNKYRKLSANKNFETGCKLVK